MQYSWPYPIHATEHQIALLQILPEILIPSQKNAPELDSEARKSEIYVQNVEQIVIRVFVNWIMGLDYR